jgi:hypothetical protein
MLKTSYLLIFVAIVIVLVAGYYGDVDKEVWIVMLTGISVVIGALTYREIVLSRTEKRARVDVEWKVPAKVFAKHKQKTDMYFFIEGIFTNSGGKAVSAIELECTKDGFVFAQKTVVGQPIILTSYEHQPEFFILPKPFKYYLKNLLEIHSEKSIPLVKELPLNFTVDPGKSHRFTTCFVFRDWKPKISDEKRDILVAFLVRFNNGQTAKIGVCVGGGGTLAKIQSEVYEKDIKEITQN